MLKIGIDTGGTFTDFIAVDGRNVRTLKLLSTPSNPALAVVQGLKELAGGLEAEILHGSTVATNALLERKGTRTALITTRGFEDVLEIGRQNRPKIYSLFPSRPDPLVPARRRFGVTERVLHDGSVLAPLRSGELPDLARKLRTGRVESLAIRLLLSFANPDHEIQIGRFLRNLNIPISLSHAILPEYREYERTTCAISPGPSWSQAGTRTGPVSPRVMPRWRKPPGRIRLERWIDMRCRGQSFEISLPFSRAFERDFHRRHELRYGYSDSGRESRSSPPGSGRAPSRSNRGFRRRRRADATRLPPDSSTRMCDSRGGPRRTPVYERSRLHPGNRIDGPARVLEYSASTAVPPGFHCEVDPYRNLLIGSGQI